MSHSDKQIIFSKLMELHQDKNIEASPLVLNVLQLHLASLVRIWVQFGLNLDKIPPPQIPLFRRLPLFCADSSLDSQAGTCNGDSGGPALVR